MRSGRSPSRFIIATASIASPLISVVFGQVSGSRTVDENTTLGIVAISTMPASSGYCSASPDINR